MALQETLTDLQSKIGNQMHQSEWLQVEQSRINTFAEATGDHQWIHVDVERAKAESPFKTPIAHGFLTLSLISQLGKDVSDDGPAYPDLKLAVNYGLNKVRFPSPVPSESKIRATVVLKDVQQVADNALQITREVTVSVEGSEKPACVAETLTRLYF